MIILRDFFEVFRETLKFYNYLKDPNLKKLKSLIKNISNAEKFSYVITIYILPVQSIMWHNIRYFYTYKIEVFGAKQFKLGFDLSLRVSKNPTNIIFKYAKYVCTYCPAKQREL